LSGEMIEEGIPIANVSKPGDRDRVNLLVIPKRGGKSEQVFEQDFWSLREEKRGQVSTFDILAEFISGNEDSMEEYHGKGLARIGISNGMPSWETTR